MNAVTEQFVGTPAPQVVTMMIDGEALLIDERIGRSHVLNPTAALVWQCFDGEATVGEIAHDISETLGLDHGQVVSDTSRITDQLIELGAVVAPGDADGDTEDTPVQEMRTSLDQPFTLGDDGNLGVRVGDRVVVVRANDASMLGLLRAALEPHVVAAGDRPADLSLLFTARRGRVRGSHFLYARDQLVLHTASEGRLLRAAIRCAAAFGPHPSNVARLRARLLHKVDRAILVTSAAGPLPDLNGRRAAGRGWRLVDLDRVPLDYQRGEVVAPTALVTSAVGLDAIDRRFPPEPGEATLGPIRAAVAGLVVLRGDDEFTRRDSRARQAATLLPFVDRATDIDERTAVLLELTALAAKIPVRILPEWNEDALSAVVSPAGVRRLPSRS